MPALSCRGRGRAAVVAAQPVPPLLGAAAAAAEGRVTAATGGVTAAPVGENEAGVWKRGCSVERGGCAHLYFFTEISTLVVGFCSLYIQTLAYHALYLRHRLPPAFYSLTGFSPVVVVLISLLREKKKIKSKHEIKKAWFENKVLKTSTVA